MTRLRESPGAQTVLLLAALTLIEYVASVGEWSGLFVWLTVLGLAKAGLIVRSFMQLMNIRAVS
ncbi:MAG: hypothetical protein R8F63_20815 [Acidimicrobiales bacterium]|nr:hypothetical protein [Acidimicrobiales bacterium]